MLVLRARYMQREIASIYSTSFFVSAL